MTDLSPGGKIIVAAVATSVCLAGAVFVGYLGILLGIWLGFLPLWDDGASYPHEEAWWSGTLIAALLVACLPLLALIRSATR